MCSKYRVNEEGKCSYSVDDFLAILQHLLIIAPVCIDGEELFFIPSILPTSKKISPLAGKLPPLVHLCRTRVIPLGMFSALVVALLFNLPFFKNPGHNAVSLEQGWRRSSATSRVPRLAYSSLQWAPVSRSSYQSCHPPRQAAIISVTHLSSVFPR